MNRIFLIILLLFIAFPSLLNAAVSEVDGGYRVTYNVNVGTGTSNGSDIIDVMIFEWNAGGDFSIDNGDSINGQGRTILSHVIDFEPESALVLGWGAGVVGVGDEKDHLFTLTNFSFASQVTGLKWSEVFPGVAPLPRTGHNAMIGLLRNAAAGDTVARNSIVEFIQREAGHAAFNPAGNFRVIEWSIAEPLPVQVPVPLMTPFGFGILIFGLVLFARRFIVIPAL